VLQTSGKRVDERWTKIVYTVFEGSAKIGSVPF
jgi:hypothetical protein